MVAESAKPGILPQAAATALAEVAVGAGDTRGVGAVDYFTLLAVCPVKLAFAGGERGKVIVNHKTFDASSVAFPARPFLYFAAGCLLGCNAKVGF